MNISCTGAVAPCVSSQSMTASSSYCPGVKSGVARGRWGSSTARSGVGLRRLRAGAVGHPPGSRSGGCDAGLAGRGPADRRGWRRRLGLERQRAAGGFGGGAGSGGGRGGVRSASSIAMSSRRLAAPRCIMARRGSQGSGRGGGCGRRIGRWARWRARVFRTPSARVTAGSRPCASCSRTKIAAWAYCRRRGTLQGLAGEDDQVLALDLGRLASRSCAAPTRARNSSRASRPSTMRPVAALGQGRCGRAHAGGEAVGELEPAPCRRACRGRRRPPSTAAIRKGVSGAMARVKARVMGTV